MTILEQQMRETNAPFMEAYAQVTQMIRDGEFIYRACQKAGIKLDRYYRLKSEAELLAELDRVRAEVKTLGAYIDEYRSKRDSLEALMKDTIQQLKKALDTVIKERDEIKNRNDVI